MSPEEVGRYADLCREKGIANLTVEGTVIVMGPPPPPESSDPLDGLVEDTANLDPNKPPPSPLRAQLDEALGRKRTGS